MKITENKPVNKIECNGMILVLIVGLILVTCNLLFTWKFHTWSYKTWNYNPDYNSHAFSNLIFMNFLLHLPGIAGLWLKVAAINFFTAILPGDFRKNKLLIAKEYFTFVC